MTEAEKLSRDIDTMRVTINHSWREMAARHMTPEQRGALRSSIDALVSELSGLQARLDLERGA